METRTAPSLWSWFSIRSHTKNEVANMFERQRRTKNLQPVHFKGDINSKFAEFPQHSDHIDVECRMFSIALPLDIFTTKPIANATVSLESLPEHDGFYWLVMVPSQTKNQNNSGDFAKPDNTI